MRALKMRSYLHVIVIALVLSILPQIQTTAQESRGMLAVVGTDGNLSIYDSNGKNPFPITKDAATGSKQYYWPTWSTDGRLAFFGRSSSTDRFNLRAFVVEQVKQGAAFKTAYSSPDEVFTYAYWSP